VALHVAGFAAADMAWWLSYRKTARIAAKVFERPAVLTALKTLEGAAEAGKTGGGLPGDWE
jgi:hypothetical protein